jgi:hypothetical protein
MLHHLNSIIEPFEPLLVSLTVITIADINTMLGTISVFASIGFTAYKFYNEYKNNKRK